MKDFKGAFERRQNEMQRQIDAIDRASQGRQVGSINNSQLSEAWAESTPWGR